MNVIVIPCWAGRPQDYWYPWLAQQLAPLANVEVLAMPNPDQPCVKAWTKTARQHIEVLRPAQVIGHSVGCQAIVRALAMGKLGGYRPSVLCVAGWFTVDEPWPELCPWIDTPFDTKQARSMMHDISVLLSDNDPFTPDYVANRQLWRQKLGANVEIIAGAKHFNQANAPAVATAARHLLTRRLFSSPFATLSGNL